MNFTWIDGRLVLALIVLPVFSLWLVGYVNYRRGLRARHRRETERRIAIRRQIFAIRGGVR